MEKSSRKPNIEEGIDRISFLPDDVLHNILSSMCILDVVQLSVLSKTWKYVWTTVPYLNFDLYKFPSTRLNQRTVRKFRDFINWVLISQSATKLLRFTLFCGYIFHKVDILRWIHAATRRNVHELVLSICLLGESFQLPYCLATCDSLQVLKLDLSGGILKPSNHLGFRQLKLLYLMNVELSNEHLTSCLFSKCPLLENLILRDCSLGAMTMLDIASTSLVYVTLHNYNDDGDSYSNCEVKISCPNLKCLKYKAPMAKGLVFENLFSIEVVRIFFVDPPDSTDEEIAKLVHLFKGINSTSTLQLCLASIVRLYGVAHEKRLSPLSFYNLKSLKLVVEIEEACIQGMTLFLKHSPNLEVLNLSSYENYGRTEKLQLHELDETIVCLESHLKLIKLTDFKADWYEIELLRFFLKHARVLEELIIFWDEYVEKPEEALEVVMKLPRTSSRVALTFLDTKRKRYREFPQHSEK